VEGQGVVAAIRGYMTHRALMASLTDAELGLVRELTAEQPAIPAMIVAAILQRLDAAEERCAGNRGNVLSFVSRS
jgi:hypothetical protein